MGVILPRNSMRLLSGILSVLLLLSVIFGCSEKGRGGDNAENYFCHKCNQFAEEGHYCESNAPGGLQEAVNNNNNKYRVVVEGKLIVSLRFSHSDDEIKAVRKWLEEFGKKYPECSLEVDTTVLSAESFEGMLAAHTISDVFALDSSEIPWLSEDWIGLMPLDHYMEVLNIEDGNSFPDEAALSTCGGRRYAVMTQTQRRALIYNKDLLESVSGLSSLSYLQENDEWTWETFVEYCEVISKSKEGVAGASLRLGAFQTRDPWLADCGLPLLSDCYPIKTSFSVANKKHEDMAKAVRGGSILYREEDLPVSVNSAVFFDVDYDEIGSFVEQYEAENINWDTIAFPGGKDSVEGRGFAVYNRTSNPDAAAVLCLSLLEEKNAEIYCQGFNSIPAMMTVAEKRFSDERLKIFMPEKETERADKTYFYLPPEIRAEASELLNSTIKEWSKKIGSAYMLRKADEKINALLEEYYNLEKNR